MSSRCGSCSAPIIWAATGATNRPIPIDPVPVLSGNIELELRADGLAPYAKTWGSSHTWPEGTLRYRSHFVSCPQAAEHRRRR